MCGSTEYDNEDVSICQEDGLSLNESFSLENCLLDESATAELFAKLDSLEKKTYYVSDTDTESIGKPDQSDPDYVPETESENESESDNDQPAKHAKVVRRQTEIIEPSENERNQADIFNYQMLNGIKQKLIHLLTWKDQTENFDHSAEVEIDRTETDQPPKKRCKKARPEKWKQNVNKS